MPANLVIHLSDPDSPGNVLCRDRKVVDAVTDHAETYNCRYCQEVVRETAADPVPVVAIPVPAAAEEMSAEVLAAASFRPEFWGQADALKELADFSGWLLTGEAHSAYLSSKDAAGTVESEICLLPGNPDFVAYTDILYEVRAQQEAYQRKYQLSNSAYLPTGSSPGVIERCLQEPKRKELLTQFAEFLLFSRLGAWVKCTNDSGAGRDDFIVERHTDFARFNHPRPGENLEVERGPINKLALWIASGPAIGSSFTAKRVDAATGSGLDITITDEPVPAAPEPPRRTVFDDWCWFGAAGSVFTATKDAVDEVTYDITLPTADNPDPATDAFTFADREKSWAELIDDPLMLAALKAAYIAVSERMGAGPAGDC